MHSPCDHTRHRLWKRINDKAFYNNNSNRNLQKKVAEMKAPPQTQCAVRARLDLKTVSACRICTALPDDRLRLHTTTPCTFVYVCVLLTRRFPRIFTFGSRERHFARRVNRSSREARSSPACGLLRGPTLITWENSRDRLTVYSRRCISASAHAAIGCPISSGSGLFTCSCIYMCGSEDERRMQNVRVCLG